MNHRKSAVELLPDERLRRVEKMAKDIDDLRVLGERDPHAACGEYDVKPRDYGLGPNEYRRAWADYEESRVESIFA